MSLACPGTIPHRYPGSGGAQGPPAPAEAKRTFYSENSDLSSTNFRIRPTCIRYLSLYLKTAQNSILMIFEKKNDFLSNVHKSSLECSETLLATPEGPEGPQRRSNSSYYPHRDTLSHATNLIRPRIGQPDTPKVSVTVWPRFAWACSGTRICFRASWTILITGLRPVATRISELRRLLWVTK